MKYFTAMVTVLGILVAQDDFIGDVFDNGSVNYGDRTIQAIGIGFIPENVIKPVRLDGLLCGSQSRTHSGN